MKFLLGQRLFNIFVQLELFRVTRVAEIALSTSGGSNHVDLKRKDYGDVISLRAQESHSFFRRRS